jgi:hypothetical protein
LQRPLSGFYQRESQMEPPNTDMASTVNSGTADGDRFC